MRNISVVPLLSIGGTATLAQAMSQQGFCSNDFKTESSSLVGQKLHKTIQAFGVASGVRVREVVEDGISILLDGQGKGPEHFSHIGGNLVQPGEVALQGFFFGGSFIDLVKRLLELIGSGEPGKVVQPGFYNQPLAFIEIMSTPEQQVAVVHQCLSLAVAQTMTCLLAHGFQTAGEQFQDMPFVYHEVSVGQELAHDIVVDRPHVRTHNGDSLAYRCGQARQVGDQSRFIPVSEQVDHLMTFYVTQDAAGLVQQVQFIDTQARDRSLLPVRFKMGGKFTKEQANTCLCQPDFISDADKGSTQRLLLDVVDQAAGAKVVLVHIWQGFKEGSAAAAAPKAAAQDGDAHALSSDWQVHIQLSAGFVLVKLCMLTESTASWRKETFRLNVQIMLVFVYRQDTKVCKFENIQQPLSLHQGLPHEFSYRRANLVLKKAEFSYKFPTNSTHFCDVDHFGRSVKIERIPRTFAISLLFEEI